MYSNLRSLIFKIDPERAHFLAIQSLKLNLVSNIFDENKNDPILKTKLFNQNLDNPIGIAAGFDKNAEVYNPCLLYTSDAADDRSRGLGDVYKRQTKELIISKLK